jgi:hypothetical protein
MKLVLSLMLLGFSTLAFSNTIFFQCKTNPVPGVNEFWAKGVVTINTISQTEGLMDIVVQKINEVESAQVYEQVKITGVLKHFNPGEVTKNAFDQLILTTDHPYLKSMNLLIDENTALSSQVLSIDNFLYRSNCESMPEIH